MRNKFRSPVLLQLILIALFTGIICVSGQGSGTPKLLILKLSYDSVVFEEGYEMTLSNKNPVTGKTPFSVIYNKPADFGDISFIYDPTGQTVFKGTIIWNGKGTIEIPGKFLKQESFRVEKDPSELPPFFDSIPYTESYASLGDKTVAEIWSQIGKLSKVKAYVTGYAKMAVYLYKPSVGIFDPSAAKWIVFFYKP